MLMFFLRSFRKVRFQKMQFLKDGVQTVVFQPKEINRQNYYMYAQFAYDLENNDISSFKRYKGFRDHVPSMTLE